MTIERVLHMRYDHSSRSTTRLRCAAVSTVALVVLLAGLLLAACGSSGTSSSPTPTVTATVTASPDASPTAATTGAGADATAEPSPTVMALQSDLKKAGYYTGKLTGVYDAATGAAVKEMEAALKVKGADSQYDAQTYAAEKTAGKQSMTTSFVMQVQSAMQQLGFYAGNIDGVYGAKTVAAVKAFQTSVGLTPDGIAGPKTIAAYEAQIKGDSTVASLQQQLKSWGYYTGPIDGVYGPSTVAAVKALQTALGVTPVDGRWGPKTQAAAQAAHKGGGKSSVITMQIQTDLSTLGYYKGSIDGVYGSSTKAAVMAFQRDHGLTADGVAGPKTTNAINEAMRYTGG
jgi:peptidoglycan hydrolase-like protein with peptidoglycan-binding domain